ncbi:VOC family protein [Ensifer soli]|uniref:VOC family protein n=1 Tax=Ciceribacter sp. sgz301302 TaxID=3342379 RepID=UPI0035BA2200
MTALEGVLESALYAGDLDAAEAFYGSVLGLERVSRAGDRHVFFRCGAGMVLIFNPRETEKAPPEGALPVPAHGSRGPGHLCFRVDRSQMDAVVVRLTSAGVAIESDLLWPNGARSFYFRDPAGNSLECGEARLWNIEQDGTHAQA